MVMEGGACAHRASRLLSAGGGSDGDGRAAGSVARCRARCPASAPAPVITPTTVTPRAHPYLPAARPSVPPFRTLLTTASATAMAGNLLSRQAGPVGLGGGVRRGLSVQPQTFGCGSPEA